MNLLADVLASGELPLRRYAETMRKSYPDVLEEAARGVVKRAMGITPPGNDPNGLTLSARYRGEAKIARDLSSIFVPVKLKGLRRERWPNPAAIHATRFRASSRMNGRITRGQAQAYYVDATKLKPLVKSLFSNVGKLASGWVNAAQALNARGVPAWVARHGASRGAIQVDTSGDQMFISMTNFAKHTPAVIVEATQRRANAALQYQAAAMQRSMMGFLSRKAVEAGLASYITAG